VIGRAHDRIDEARAHAILTVQRRDLAELLDRLLAAIPADG
jgi:hypothetical protein